MTPLDSIWNRARADLAITTEQGDLDVFLWEHSERVAQGSQWICTLPGVAEQHPDETAVVAAALYHDAGWLSRVRDGDIAAHEILSHPPADSNREQSTLMMEGSLAKVLPRASLERASRTMLTLHDRDVEFIEGKIVADADNLDEFGLLSLWPTIRRGALEGKGVQAVLDTWHRRTEYHFWTARLNDAFRFAAVRAIAKNRLKKLERYMADLEEQHRGADVTK